MPPRTRLATQHGPRIFHTRCLLSSHVVLERDGVRRDSDPVGRRVDGRLDIGAGAAAASSLPEVMKAADDQGGRPLDDSRGEPVPPEPVCRRESGNAGTRDQNVHRSTSSPHQTAVSAGGPGSGDQQQLLVCAFQGTLVRGGGGRGPWPKKWRRCGVVPVAGGGGDFDGMPAGSARI